MNKFITIIIYIVLFVIIGIASSIGKRIGGRNAYWQPSYTPQHQETTKTFETLNENSSTNRINKRKFVDDFTAIKFRLPMKIDDFTIAKEIYSQEITPDTFSIHLINQLTINKENIDEIAQDWQSNMVDNYLNKACQDSSFFKFNQIEGITLYIHYFIDEYEVFTMTIPDKSCNNHMLGKMIYNPLPIKTTPSTPSTIPSSVIQNEILINETEQNDQISSERNTKQCRQIVKNMSYYLTYANYCDMEVTRTDDSFNEELNAEDCNLNSEEVENLVNETQSHFEKSAERADDYEAFCRKEYNYWKKIDQYPN